MMKTQFEGFIKQIPKEVRTMPEDLRVDIPEEFKQKLMDRFTPSPSEKRVARIDHMVEYIKKLIANP